MLTSIVYWLNSIAPVCRLPTFSKKAPARIADGIRIYAIGDVHGRADLLQPLLERVRAHMRAHPTPRPLIVFLGDYIDRGPSSRQVIDQLISLRETFEVIALKGNHEHYLIEFLENPPSLTKWLRFGGLDTLHSYRVLPNDHSDATEQELVAMSLSVALHQSKHLTFFGDLKTSFTCGDFFFVHAGVRPGVALDRQSEKDLLEIRNPFLLSKSNFGKTVVHGHTPVLEPDIRSNRINIDTGAYATGKLSCLIIERDELDFL